MKGVRVMTDFTKNIGYFVSEVKTIFMLNLFSGVLSVISLIMIFFVLQLALAGWWTSSAMVSALKEEAEVSVYYASSVTKEELQTLKTAIAAVDGVKMVTPVSADAAYSRMSEIMGSEAKVLSSFDQNPFEAYLEVGIVLDKLEGIPDSIRKLSNVEHVRDNRTVLEKLNRIVGAVTALGTLIAAAVSVATFIITSHIIREGVHSHREQIGTLKLLGAPDAFINAPFLIEGVLLTLTSGLVSSMLFAAVFQRIDRFMSEALPFLPSTGSDSVIQGTVAGIMALALLMGIAASRFGLMMVKEK